jgi:branched-chain amino acid transport system permease protein
VTFGLSIIIQNFLLEVFSADDRRLDAGWIETASIRVAGQVTIGWYPLIVFAVAVLTVTGLQVLLGRTALGRAFRATADDQETVRLMGIDNRHTFALAVAIAFAIVALAGVFLGIRTTFSPDVGPGRLLVAFETVVIGGLGSLWGTLAGGVILGVAHAVGAKLDPAYRELAGHLIFLLVLLVRPQGLFARPVREA